MAYVPTAPIEACGQFGGISVMKRVATGGLADGYIYVKRLLDDMKAHDLVPKTQTWRKIIAKRDVLRAVETLQHTVSHPYVQVNAGDKDRIGTYVHPLLMPALSFLSPSLKAYVAGAELSSNLADVEIEIDASQGFVEEFEEADVDTSVSSSMTVWSGVTFLLFPFTAH
jgi:hypothetical protein